MEFVDILKEATIKCPKCGEAIVVNQVGTAVATSAIGRCLNDRCVVNDIGGGEVVGEGLYPINLTVIYLNLLSDSGYRGYQDTAWGLNLNSMDKTNFYKHTPVIFSLMRLFFEANMPLARKDVVNFYERNNIAHKDERGMLEVTISQDGSFDSRLFATKCTNFIVDVPTGRPLDVIMTEKCVKCPNSHLVSDNGNCPDGKFHGASGDMEKYNAIELFSRSEAIGFQYTSWVGDGDNKCTKALAGLGLYGGKKIRKMECANHLGKRCYRMIKLFGDTWTGVGEYKKVRGLGLHKQGSAKPPAKGTGRKAVKRLGNKGAGKSGGKGGPIKGASKKRNTNVKGNNSGTNGKVNSVAESTQALPEFGPVNKPPPPLVLNQYKPKPKSKPKSKNPKMSPSRAKANSGNPSYISFYYDALKKKQTGKDGYVNTDPVRPNYPSLVVPLADPLADIEESESEETPDSSNKQEVPLVVPRAKVGKSGEDRGVLGARRHSPRSTSKRPVSYAEEGVTEHVAPEIAEDVGPEVESGGSLEPPDDDILEPVDSALSGTKYWVPPYLLKRHSGAKKKFKVKHMFDPKLCNKVARLYRLAVYSHCGDGPIVQAKAVMSILYHEMDHSQTTHAQRLEYHSLCGVHCGFVDWRKNGDPDSEYSKTTTKDYLGNSVPWRDGVYAGFDSCFPEALRVLEQIFRYIGNPELMSRCSQLVTQNINELMHFKVWNIVKKIKGHTLH